MRSRILGALVVAVALAGCGGTGVPVPRATGAVTGHVMIRACGGAYPMQEMQETPCPIRPAAAATLTFQLGGSSTSSRITTDSTGAYRVDLQPGTYTVDVAGAGTSPRSSGPRQVTVTAGKTVTADFTYTVQLM